MHHPIPSDATLADLQSYIQALESRKGWLDADLVRCCFLMGEEVGEVFKAVRRYEAAPDAAERQRELGHELVDVLNYLLAIANRAQIDLDAAFREKNTINEGRTWADRGPR